MSALSGNAPLLNHAHRLAWQLILTANGAGDKPTLNNRDAPEIPEDPAQALFNTANKVKAEAIDETGKQVDYKKLAETECYQQLRNITGSLSACSLENLGNQSKQLAFWINLYNSLILDAIICYGIEGRVPFSLFLKAAYNVCGLRFSADDIEHGVLRGNQAHPVYRLKPFSSTDPRQAAAIKPFDPRIHFALNCGARSCPPIAIYRADQIEDQLATATASFIGGGGAQVDLGSNELSLSPVFNWYQSDFGGESGVLTLIASHLPEEEAEAIRSGRLKIHYRDYDWSVNKVIG